MSTPSLRSSKDIYNRIKWDLSEQSDINEFAIGYLDRFDGMKEMSFSEFEPGGDVPWHRIYHFRKKNEIIWDRQQKIDKVFGSGGFTREASKPNSKNKKSKKFAKRNDTNPHDLAEDWPPNGYESKSFFTFYDNKWQTCIEHQSERPSKSTFTILTYNILFGLYEHEQKTFEDQRLELLMKEIEQMNPDILLLQEVTAYSLQFLQDQNHIRSNYSISTVVDLTGDVDRNGDLPNYGQIILSRFPIRKAARRRLYSSHKYSQLLLLQVSSELQLAVVNIHFTSPRKEVDADAETAGTDKRILQLKTTLSLANETENVPVLVCGDFNYSDDGPEAGHCVRLQTKMGYSDVWLDLHPEEPGYTFNPKENQVANITSDVNFEPRRLDRVLLHDPEGILCARKIKIVGNESNSSVGEINLLPSDHYGLLAEFSVTPHLGSAEKNTHPCVNYKAVFTSALCLVPPKEGPLYRIVQKLRKKRDPSFMRWPPHLNILYSFIPDIKDNFEKASEIVQSSLEDWWGPYENAMVLYFNRFGVFDRGNSAYVFLFPEFEPREYPTIPMFFTNTTSAVPTGFEHIRDSVGVPNHPLNNLYQLLCLQFPKLGEWKSLVPHLTVGKFESESEAADFALKCQSEWLPISCEFFGLTMMSRSGDKPFETVHEIPLNPQTSWRIPPTLSSRWVVNPCGLLSKHMDLDSSNPSVRSRLFAIGSAALGLDDVDSDYDLCVCSTEKTNDLLHKIENLSVSLSQVGNEAIPLDLKHLSSMSHSGGCRMNLVRFLDQNSMKMIDVSLATLPAEMLEIMEKGGNVPADQLKTLDPASMLAVSGVLDLHQIALVLNHELYRPVSRRLVGVIKRWARIRCLDSKNFGFPPSSAWAVMALHAMLQMPENAFDWVADDDSNHFVYQILVEFFNLFGHVDSYNQGKVYGLEPQNLPEGGAADHVFNVPCPTYPHSNQCSKIMKSTAEIIRKECVKAHMALERTPYDQRSAISVDNFVDTSNFFFKIYENYLIIEAKLIDGQDSEEKVNEFSSLPETFRPKQTSFSELPTAFMSECLRLESKLVKLFVNVEGIIMRSTFQKYPVIHPKSERFVEASSSVRYVAGLEAGSPKALVHRAIDAFCDECCETTTIFVQGGIFSRTEALDVLHVK